MAWQCHTAERIKRCGLPPDERDQRIGGKAHPDLGRPTRNASDVHLSTVTPSGLTFAIWSMIYIVLLDIFVVHQLVYRPSLRSTYDRI